jgi:molybdopterin-binding protein
MKLELNIKSDEALRSHIKDMIKGQVVSVIRKETLPELKNAIAKILEENETSKSLKKLIEEIVKEEIKKHVLRELGKSGWNTESYIRKEAKKHMRKKVKDTLVSEAHNLLGK